MKSVLVALALILGASSVEAGDCAGGHCRLSKSKEVVKKVVKKVAPRRCKGCK